MDTHREPGEITEDMEVEADTWVDIIIEVEVDMEISHKEETMEVINSSHRLPANTQLNQFLKLLLNKSLLKDFQAKHLLQLQFNSIFLGGLLNS